MASQYHTEFDQGGFPTFSYLEGGVSFMTGAMPSASPGIKPTVNTPNREESNLVGKWVPWGLSDTFPEDVASIVRKSNIASPALLLLTKLLHGKRLILCRVKGFDEKGNELIEYVDPVKEPEPWEVLNRSNINMWRLKMAQDFCYFRNAFPEIILQKDRAKIYSLGYNKAAHCRYSPYNPDKKRVESVFVSGTFPVPLRDDLAIIPAINPDMLDIEVERVKSEGAYKYIFPTKFPDVINNYYSLAYWDGSRSNGWMDISLSIPAYKKALFRNQMSIKYHIQIPQSYWTNKFTTWNNMSVEEKSEKVDALQKSMNDYLTGADNAMKTFITYFGVGHDGKAFEDGWKITQLDDKLNKDAYLPDSAAANAEILFSMLVNPALTGVSVSSGSYAGGANNGGSNMREAHLIASSLLQADRDCLYNIWEFIKLYNGYDQNIEIRIMDQVLTTIDQGAGTKKVIS